MYALALTYQLLLSLFVFVTVQIEVCDKDLIIINLVLCFSLSVPRSTRGSRQTPKDASRGHKVQFQVINHS